MSIVVATLLVSCDDKSSNPVIHPRDYPIYFWDASASGRFFAYHPVDKSIDTFTLDMPVPYWLKVSANGSRLYIPCSIGCVVADAISHEIIDTLNIPGAVTESGDGRLAALVTDSLIIIRRRDSSRVIALPDGSSDGRFTGDSKHYLTTGTPGQGRDRYVICATLSSNVGVFRKSFDSCSVFDVGGNCDGTRWFLYVAYDTFVCGFLVYDVPSDSIIFRHQLIPGAGFIAVTNDYVVYTNGGSTLVGPPPPSEFYIYDIKANTLKATVSTVGAKDGTNPIYLPTSEVAVTPDGKDILLLEAAWGRTLLHYSLSQRKFLNYVEMGQNTTPWYLSCQTGR